MSVAILREGDYLIASIQSDLSDREVVELRNELTELVGIHRARGIVIDVAALDVIDSFVARALRDRAHGEVAAPRPSSSSASSRTWRSRWCISA